MSTITISDYDPSTFDKLVDLFASYFQIGDKLLSREYTEWLYLKNPCGSAKVVVVKNDGRWVAFMAMIPVNLVSNGERLLGYYVVNVLVHADYQGKFLFGKMIAEAKKFVVENNAVMFGHPNGLAIKTWHRAKMIFFPELRPYFIVPRWKGWHYSVDVIKSADQLDTQLPVDSQYTDEKNGVRQIVNRDYIQWRFFDHPVNKYRIQLLRYKGLPCGLMISRLIKYNLGLLIDLFVPPEHIKAALCSLPMCTIAFMPETPTRALTQSAWAVPVKKRMPFFFGHVGVTNFSNKTVNINLSASDF